MDELTFYFDRNFGKRLPNALSKLRPPVGIRWHQGEGFRHDMADDEWMQIVGSKNWVVLTQDLKFHLIESEIAALKQHSIRCFYFPDAKAGMWNSLCVFIRTHKKLIELSHESGGPCIYKVLNNGAVKALYPLKH